MILLDLIDSYAFSRPDAEALLAPGYRPVSYGRLRDQITRIGSQLHAWGIGRRDRIVLALSDGPEMSAVFLATAAYATCAPLNPALRKGEYEFYLDDLKPQAIIVAGKSNHPAAEAAESRGILVFDLIAEQNEAAVFKITLRGGSHDFKSLQNSGPAQEEDIALILYTSGTTSGQKAVPLTHRNICESAQNIAQSLELTPEDRCLNVMPLFHIHGLMAGLLSSLAAGGSVVCPPGFLAPLFFDWMAAFDPTWYTAVPTMHQAILARSESNGHGSGSLRFIRSSSAPLSPGVAESLEERFRVPVVEAYGMTEAAHQVCVNPLLPSKRKRGSVGPVSSTEVAIMDLEGGVVSPGEEGEVVIRGQNVMSGYLDNSEENAQAFSNGWLRTGDLGRIDEEGHLFLTGRIKEIINRGGENVSPHEVDAALLRHPHVAQAAAFPMPDTRMGEEVGAAVVLENGAQMSAQEIMAFVSEQLADFKVPRRIVFLEELPKGPTGKVQRAGLAERLGLNGTSEQKDTTYVAPRTDPENELVRIWKEVLRIERVGIHDDFFAVGGDSILATQVISRVRSTLYTELPMMAFFQGHTVAELAEWVHQSQATSSNGSMAGHQETPLSIPKKETHASTPLSFAQERIWFFHQFEPDSPVYNRADAFRLKGRLDRASLNQALTALVARHEVLRTVYRTEDGIPLQVVQSPRPIELEAVDLSQRQDSSSEEAIQHLVDEEARRLFDLSKDLMLRAKLVRLQEEDHVFIITTHHIAADGWSSEVMLREISELYAAYSIKQKPDLTELPIQYADYSLWQREWLKGDRLEAQLAYWKENLDGCPALLEFPTDHPRPAQQTYRGSVEQFSLPAELLDALKELSQREGVTLFMTLLAGFQTLISRYTRSDDIVVGTPIAGRTRVETENLIGVFINTLALRTDLSGNPTFRELLKRVREVTLGAYAHQDLPFEKLVRALQVERSLAHSPLIQVMFNFQNQISEEFILPGLHSQKLNSNRGAAIFDLTISLRENHSRLEGCLEYSTDLFERETIARMVGHFQMLLKSIVENPDQQVSDLSILSDAERHKLLFEWNDTHTAYPRGVCIHELVEGQVERTPNAVALDYAGERLTYRELNERANQLAHHLQKRGVGPEVLVGICVERSLEMVVGLLGILKAGGAYVPLDPEYPRDRLAIMLEDARAPILLTQERLVADLPAVGAEVICLDTDWDQVALESQQKPASKVSEENLAYVIFTSGSTGRPKGAMNAHSGVCNRLLWMQDAYQLDETDRILQKTPFSFDVSGWEFYWPLMTGACLVMARPGGHQDSAYLVKLIAKEKITTLHFVPSMLQIFLEEEDLESCSSLRRVICSGEALPFHLQERFFDRLGAELHNLYGPTEAAIDVTYWECQRESLKPIVPIGRPIANTQIYILDPHLQPVPSGIPGELYIGGANVGRGYLNRPEFTAECFIPDPFSNAPDARLYKTGDLARFLADGNIEFLGRMDHQVKIRGFRIELGEIEAVLLKHPGVCDCAVLAREDGPGERRLVAYLETDNREAPSVEALRGFLREKLPEYMIPSAFVFLDSLPLSPNGKLDRKALPAPQPVRPELEKAFVAPQTEAEEKLALIWAEILKLDQVGIHDNFLELGGHSLLATVMASRIREDFGLELPINRVFEEPTIADLAKWINQQGDVPESNITLPAIQSVPREGGLPVSFGQEQLWVLNEMYPNLPLYNEPKLICISEAIDVEVLEKAINQVVRRHEAFRTSFDTCDGQPNQVIHEEVVVPLPVVDLTALPRAEQEAEALRLATADSQTPFDLTQFPLFRVRLFKLHETDFRLLIVFHHIITDYITLRFFVKELQSLYRAFSAGKPSPLTPLPLQYVDYACWQRQWLQGDVLKGQLSYWKKKLASLTPLDFPTDYPRPRVQSLRGDRQYFTLSKELVDRLKSLSIREGVTLFMTLLSAFKAQLWRYKNQDDIAVGTVVHGRNRSEIDPLMGYFLNTLVMRTDLFGVSTFVDLMKRVRHVALEALAHQDLPFAKLVAELQPRRDPTRNPLFQVAFILEPPIEEDHSSWRFSQETPSIGTSKFDLTLWLEERPTGMVGSFKYNTDLFEHPTITRMIGHLQNLLEGIAENPDRNVSKLPLLTEGERQEVVLEWNDTARKLPHTACLHELFEAQAARTPDATAVVFEDEHLTYRELNERANQLAHYLRGRGVGPEVMVGLLVESSLEMLIGMLGILKAGGAYVPLDPEYPPERMFFMLEDTRAPVLVTQERLLEKLPAYGAHVVCLDADRAVLDQEPRENPVSGVRGENLFYVIYTSGSTGNPKGVAVEHRQLNQYLTAVVERMGLPEDTSYAMVSSIAADAGITMIFPPLCNGGCLHVLSQERVSDPEAMADYFESHPVDCLKMVPSLLEMLLTAKNPERGLPRKLLMVGGESTRLDLVERFQALNPGCRLINHYGPTEATVGVTTYWVNDPLPSGAATLPIGRPLANSQIYLLDTHLEPVPIGVAGELHIGGANLAREYLNLPELTAEKFIPDPFSDGQGARLYKTGDLARYLPDGSIEFLGRIDDQVKIRGFRIELGEIETVLSEHTDVDQCVVLAREDVPGDKRLVAYLVGSREETPAAPELRSFLKEKLPDYMVPSAFVMLDALPRTPNGKLNRKALPVPDSTRPELERAYVAPRTEMEKTLAEIWIDVLKVDKVGTQDNFFELGGHSLLATVFISRARKTLNIDLPIRSVFENPTVAELAQKIGNHEIERSGHVEMKPSPRKHFIPRKKTKGPYALSFSQERIWFLEQLEECGSAYNIYRAFRLKGELDKEALRKALQAIVDRHDSLRTTFHLQGDVPVQVVDSDRAIDLEEFDLRGKPEEDAWHLIDRDAEIPFDLTQDLMLRASLYQLSEGVHVLLLVMHHIASDGWSMGIFYRELSEIYADYAAGRTPTLPALPMHYADFAVWQREWLTGERMEEEFSFWKERMADSPALLELPTDRPRPVRQTYRGACEKFALPEELFRVVQKFSQKEHATLFITLLSVFQTLLYRYTGSEDIVVGSPIAGRTNTRIEGIIGFFVNTLLFRADLSGNPTFRQLVKRIRDTALNAYDHQVLPFEKLVAELQPERSLSHSPLFQIMFILQNAHSETLNIPGLKIEQQHLETSTSKFDLTLSLRKAGETLEGILEYNTDLFDRSTIKRMVEQFQTLLQSAVTDPECSLSNLPILSDNERRQLLVEWNCTQKDHPNFCIHELFEKQVEKTPGATAVVFEEAHLTYTELNQRANQVAHHLRKRRVGLETLVGICLERSFEMVVGLLGILKAGGAYVPLDPSYPKQRLAFMLEDSGASVLVTQGRLLSKLPLYECEVVCLDTDQEAIAQERKENPTSDVTAEELAYVLYTSGSTGKPKGVAMPHGPLVNLVAWQCGHSACGEAVRTLQYAPFGFDVSFQEIFSTWCSGGTLVLINDDQRRDPVETLHLIDQKKIKRLFLPFLALEQLAEAACRMALLPASLREVITAGEQLRVTPEILHLFEQLPGCQLVNQYGPTEAHVVSACELSGAPDNWSRLPPIGRPISNATLYVLDQNLEPVPIGVPGELHIGGASLARGYLNRPELTAEKFIPDPFSKASGERLYKTGDLCRYLQDGNIEFLGRIDDQVKIRGFRIELGEIEVVLQKHPGVGACAAIDREDVSGNKRLVAYVVAAGQQAPSVEGLRDFLQNELPEYMVPDSFVMLDSLPLTTSGKVDRQALPAPDHRRPELEKAYVAPRTETEEALAHIWAEILQVEQVGINDNFFELGGHSLMATQVIARVHSQMGEKIPLVTLFELPTVGQLARKLTQQSPEESCPDGTTNKRQAEEIPRRRSKGPCALSFAQERLWFLDQLEPNTSLFHISNAYRLEGALDRNALEKALRTIVARHETLRTTYRMEDERPVQVIDPNQTIELEESDLRGMGYKEVQLLVQKEARRPFDLSRDLMLRATLYRLDGDAHVLLLVMHHIASDGWSMGIVYRELSELYMAYTVDRPPDLPELSIQYADYAELQREWLEGEKPETQLSYWKEQLAGSSVFLNLPTDRPRPPRQTFQGALETEFLSEELTAAIKSLSQREGCTLFMALLAGFKTLLHRCTGQDEIIVGAPIAGRTQPEFEKLIGVFLNTLALRSDLSGNPTFCELLGRVREVTLGAYANQEVPFEKLLEELKPERDLSRTPLFQVFFNMKNYSNPCIEMHGLKVDAYALPDRLSKFDLTLYVKEQDRGIHLDWVYNIDLFDQLTISTMAKHFRTLLKSIVADPAQRLSDLQLLTESEQNLRSVRANGHLSNKPFVEFTKQALSQSIPDRFREQVRKYPQNIAVKTNNHAWTYEQLNRESNRMSQAIFDLSGHGEERIAVLFDHDAPMIAGILGALKAGKTYVPLDPEYPVERLAYVLADSGANLLLTDDVNHSLAEELIDGKGIQLVNTNQLGTIEADQTGCSAVSAEDLAYILYTSGSTGHPKGVVQNHRNVLHHIKNYTNALHIGADDKLTLLSSYGFDAAIMDIFGALLNGATLYPMNIKEERVGDLQKLLMKEEITIFHSTPTAFRYLFSGLAGEETFPHIRSVVLGGEAVDLRDVDLYKRFFSSESTLINCFGASESSLTSLYPVHHETLLTRNSVPIGHPVEDMEIALVDEWGHDTEVFGEIAIKGPQVALGYWQDSEMTQAVFLPDPRDENSRIYRTGDMGRLLPDGAIEFLGRKDRQIKIRGFRIEPGEIESKLLDHAAVSECVVLSHDVQDDGTLVAYVTTDDKPQPSIQALRDHLAKSLPQYMIPSHFITLDALLRTPNGKIDQRALPEPESTRPDLEKVFVAPCTEVEKDLAEIWIDFLNVDRVGIYDNFFELGGHSLLATRIVSRVRAQMHVDLPLITLFEMPTIQKLAEVIVSIQSNTLSNDELSRLLDEIEEDSGQ